MIKRKVTRIIKRLSRVRKRLFPELKSFEELTKEMFSEQRYLEYGIGKRIEDFNDSDIKAFPYMYARWKTMRRLFEIQMNLMSFRLFDIDNLKKEERMYFNGR